jgi:hypothetical protein
MGEGPLPEIEVLKKNYQSALDNIISSATEAKNIDDLSPEQYTVLIKMVGKVYWMFYGILNDIDETLREWE